MRKIAVKDLENKLFGEISQLIEESRNQLAQSANIGMTFLYWKIGYMISNKILTNQRADYGKGIVVSLSRQLKEEYGRGRWNQKF
jgi:hypothetical protein